ncbi:MULTISPECIES: TlpA disulfide reductase family protein [unclassified Lentimicrobium]|uniref:TlpA family protein disulfide reductase n=1 Tax=unclassified Lentimicrobium TaxID=2677434 RepID=UPI001551BC11|nr:MULTISPECIES: TlpA disulfide reductase family protein [unclassified Lentimicrobium]NPD46992.1 TlpA family protein disulfide reductase [Lentimicrobium sp. S6]NPD83915.1 TlpA family protein disulfide reductase [Lentimicrobium sp. L6]
MNKKAIFFTLSLFLILVSAKSSDVINHPSPEKKMWAKSFIGQKAPAIEVEGWVTEPGDLKGKYVLIDIWATWCGPCRKGIPELNEWQKKFADKLVIIGISNETKEKVEPYAKEHIQYANGFDTQSRVKNELKVTGIPHVILINPEGIVIWEGFPKLPGEELTTEVLKDLLK